MLVENGKIADIAAGALPGAPEGAETVDAKGMLLAPGLIDMRVFTGEPGHEYRETLQSASEAAAAGGITSFVAMPDTMPVVDDAALVDFLVRRAAATAKVNILPAAAITKGLEGREHHRVRTVAGSWRRLLHRWQAFNPVSGAVALRIPLCRQFRHAGRPPSRRRNCSATGVMNEGLLPACSVSRALPREAESIPLDRDLQLARLTGRDATTPPRYRPRCPPTSCAVTKLRAASLSCGVSINNLSLNENDIGSYRTFFKLSPPLRSEDDRQAMIEALKDGTIDTIHSDHDPQDVEVKRRPFAEAADGAIGLETLLAAALRLVHTRRSISRRSCAP